MTKIEYALLAVILSAAYGLIKYFWPEFPLSNEVFFALILAILALIGVDVANKPVVNAISMSKVYLAKKGVLKSKAPAKITKTSKK